MDSEPLLATGLSAALAAAALWRGSLSAGGAIAAWLVGSAVWCGLGAAGFGVLCVFFFSSTLLGRVGRTRKAPIEQSYAKGGRRDAWQVFANGGVASMCGAALWWAARSGAGHVADVSSWFSIADGLNTPLGLAACASLASANADTWATELGVLSRARPWHLLRLRRVPRGTSGAVSGLGLGAAWLGACAVAASAWLGSASSSGLGTCSAIAIAGWLGCLLDSLLGATLQRQFRCARCTAVVETTTHCGASTEVAGPAWAILNNDSVNFVANLSAALLLWWALP